MRQSKRAFATLFGLFMGTANAVPVSFSGTNTGPIPDNDVVGGRVIGFEVSGLAGPVASVELSIQLSHPFAGDVTATLVAPGGVARLVVFGRPGTGRSSSVGDSSDFGGTYAFSDLGRPDLLPALQAIDSATTLPSGIFRTISRGAPGRSNAGGCPTSLRGVFAGLMPAQANGTWTLVLTDAAAGEVGSVAAATLTLDTQNPILFGNGFESAARAAPEAFAPNGGAAPARCINKVQADFTGDGLTDYAITRINGSNRDWRIRENLGNGTAAANEIAFTLGPATNSLIDSADIDGDRIADPVAWTRGSAGGARFEVRLSSRNGAVREVVFGQSGDEPGQTGDYDGDGIDDLAVFRAPPTGGPAGPLQVVILRSSDGTQATVTTGTGTMGQQFAIGGLDYTGDGLADVVVQEPVTSSTSARFRYFDALTGAQLTTFVFAQATDFLIPGNYTGSAWADVTTSRSNGTSREWRTRDSQTGLEAPLVVFSGPGDVRIGGDYDGDGLSDHAFFRPSASPGPIGFQVRPSSSTATTWSVVFGQADDLPVAGSRVR